MTHAEKLAAGLFFVKKADASTMAIILGHHALRKKKQLSKEEEKYQQNFRRYLKGRVRTGGLIGGGLGLGASAALINKMRDRPLIDKVLASLLIAGGGAGLGATTGLLSTMVGGEPPMVSDEPTNLKS